MGVEVTLNLRILGTSLVSQRSKNAAVSCYFNTVIIFANCFVVEPLIIEEQKQSIIDV